MWEEFGPLLVHIGLLALGVFLYVTTKESFMRTVRFIQEFLDDVPLIVHAILGLVIYYILCAVVDLPEACYRHIEIVLKFVEQIQQIIG